MAKRAELLAPRTLRIARVVRETADAVTLVFEDPTGGRFAFAPGQFFTLLVTVEGEVLRRAYSASSDARDEERVAVTVKRVAGGVVSNHLNDHAREGDLVQVLGPSGSFLVPEGDGRDRHIVLLAGGSGITPLLSILRTGLARDPGARFTLVYGNRGERDVIFREAIDALAHAHAPRFSVRHVLGEPSPGWTGGQGILDEETLRRELDAHVPRTDPDALYFVCGPEPMMRAARVALRTRGVADANVFEERFNMPHLRSAKAVAATGAPQVLSVRANGAPPREIYVGPEQSILEAGLSAGIAMDYSCAMGGCGACKVRLCEGEVEMEEPNCLTTGERAGGYVLACISRLRSSGAIATASDPGFAEAPEQAREAAQ